MKKIYTLILLSLVAISVTGQKVFTKGIRVGGTSKAKIDSVAVTGSYIKFYTGSTLLEPVNTSTYAPIANPVFTGVQKVGTDTLATKAYARFVGDGGGAAILVGDATVGPFFDGSVDGGQTLTFYGNNGFWTALQGGAPAANRSYRLPIAALPGAGTTSLLNIDENGNMGFVANALFTKKADSTGNAPGNYVSRKALVDSIDAISSGGLIITSNNALTLSGSGTVFDDLMFPSHTLKKVGTANKPDEDLVKMELLFPEDTTEAIGVVVQMPHKWKEGSTIYPHVHWMQAAADSVDWKIKYKWYEIGEEEPTTWGSFTMSHPTETWTTGSIHQLSASPIGAGISGAGKTLSSILIIKLYRQSDNLAGDARFLQFDIHFELDALGSRTATAK